MRSWPWYVWALIVLLPGGALVAAVLAARRAAPVGRDVDIHPEAVAAKSDIALLIGRATDQAAALRSGLKDDPVAARLLGIDPAALDMGSGQSVADKKARAEQLKADIIREQQNIGKYNQEYAANHMGGQTPEQFGSFIASVEAKIQSMISELSGLRV